MTELTISLPDALAREAQAAGLLTQQVIEGLLREAVRKRNVDRLFETMEKLSALEPALTEEEIRAEIEAARAERRSALNAGRR